MKKKKKQKQKRTPYILDNNKTKIVFKKKVTHAP